MKLMQKKPILTDSENSIVSINKPFEMDYEKKVARS